MRTSLVPLVMSLVLVVGAGSLSPSRSEADVSPILEVLAVRSVRAIEGDASPQDKARAAREARAALGSFVARIERCMRDHGSRGFRSRGQARVRLRYQRGRLPVSTEVVQSSIGNGGSECLAEILPSVQLRTAPHGDVTLEAVLGTARL